MLDKTIKSKRVVLVITCLLAFMPTLSHANSDLLLAEIAPEAMFLFDEIPIVYGASKYEQKTTEAPSSVSVITAEEIKKYGHRTLADILKSVKGFNITYDRIYTQLGVRGFNRPGDYNNRILLLVDGSRINDNIYGSTAGGTDFLIDVDLIDKVEIIPGPSSSLYGTSAFFGVINVITKQGGDIKGVEVSGETASLDTYKGRLSYGNKFQNGLGMLLSGSFYDSEGHQRLYYKEFDDPGTNNGIAENIDGDQSYSFLSKFSLNDFVLEGAYSHRKKEDPTAVYEVIFNDPRNKTLDEWAYADLRYEHTFDHDFDVSGHFFYQHYYCEEGYSWDSSDPGDPPDTVLNKEYGKGEYWGMEFQTSKILAEKHKIILGGEYRDNFRQDQKSIDIEPYYLYLDDQRRSQVWALYGQGEYLLLEDLILNLGVRYDRYDTFGGSTNPRVALIYTPWEKTTFKALYGQAFRAPTVYELYYNDGDDTQKSNPDLNPEKIRTYELVYNQFLTDHLRFVLSGFYYTIHDLISGSPDPADDLYVFRNVDEIKAKGLELELEGKWPNGLEGRISYAFQDSEYEASGGTLSNSPGHLAKFNLIAPLAKDKLFAGLEVQYTSERKTEAGNVADDFVVTNLTLLTQNLLEGLEISAGVYNLFNQGYGFPGGGESVHVQDVIEQDGRTFRMKFTYRF